MILDCPYQFQKVYNLCNLINLTNNFAKKTRKFITL